MSSIGRTRITASQLFAFSAGMIMLAGASHFSLQTFDKITQNGPISVNFSEYAWLKDTKVEFAEVDNVEISSAQTRIESAVEKGQIKISAPRALSSPKVFAKKRTIRGTPSLVISEKAPLMTASLDEVPSETLSTPLNDLVSLPTVQEVESMQRVYLQMRRQFAVAIQNLPAMNTRPTLVAKVTRPATYFHEGLDQIPEVKLSADEEAFLSVYETAAVIVDDEISIPASSTTAEVVAEKKFEPTKLPEIKTNPPAPTRQEILAANSIVAEHNLNPAALTLPSTTHSVIQTTIIDEVPESPAPEVKGASPPTVIAKIEPEAEPKAPMKIESSSTHAKIPVADPISEDIRAYTEDLSAALDSHPDQEDEYPKKVNKPKTVTTQFNDVPKVDRSKISTSSSSTSIVTQQSSAIRRAAPVAIAKAEKNAGEVNGVKTDPGGVTIAWDEHEPLENADRLLDSDIGSSFQIGKPSSTLAAKTFGSSMNQKSVTDPKRYCDSALIGKEALLLNGTDSPMSVCRRSVSFEGSKGEQSRWWEVRESTSHWPTLIWQKENQAFSEKHQIPMLSFNSVKLLSALSKSEAQNSAGIVFGEIPAGLEIGLSGRSDSPMFFDRTMKPVAASEVSQARYFAYLNVAPGNPLLYVSSRGGTQSAAISILVQAGHGTFVSVPMPKLVKIKTTVFDANSASPRGVTSLSVQVIGQDGKAAVTNNRGQFEISDVVVFADYPLYLDVAPNEQSYKHRYRLSPGEVSTKDLFYFNEQTVSHWVSQLEGGVSPVSGIVVGAVSSLVHEKDATLRFGSIEKKSPLQPEVYAIGPGDELVADPKLGQNQIRFLGVQISEGASIPSVFNSRGEMIWSELVIAQPGVINVVGP